jgi:hypothetical protein
LLEGVARRIEEKVSVLRVTDARGWAKAFRVSGRMYSS